MNGRIRTFLASGAVLALTGVGLSIGGASADQPSSTLVANPTAVTVDVNPALVPPANPAHTATIVVGLPKDTCLQVFDNKQGKGQTYGIEVTPTAYATVTAVTSATGLHCGDTTTFQVAGKAVTPPDQLITFTPVAGPPGISSKLHGTTVGLTVVDTTNYCATASCTPGGESGQPAAPAVANNTINDSIGDPNGVAAACQSTFKTSSWRGKTINAVAAVMPTPESVKDTADWSSEGGWVQHVQNTMLYPVCHYTPPAP